MLELIYKNCNNFDVDGKLKKLFYKKLIINMAIKIKI